VAGYWCSIIGKPDGGDTMSRSLTVELPESTFEYLQQMASFTRQSLDQLARQSIEGNLPPSVADAPPEMQPELLSVQTLSIAELQQITHSQIPAATQERHVELLQKNSQNTISADERQ
jgi:hypothetical protein